MEERLAAIEGEVGALRSLLQQANLNFDDQKAAFASQVDEELQKHKVVLGAVVEGARAEFANLQAALQGLHDQASNACGELRGRVMKIEAEMEGHGTGGHEGGGGEHRGGDQGAGARGGGGAGTGGRDSPCGTMVSRQRK